MSPIARFATVHWIRFPSVMTPDQLALTESPRDCVSFKIGPDGPVGADGYRLPSMISGLISMRFEVLMAVSACMGVYARLAKGLQDTTW